MRMATVGIHPRKRCLWWRRKPVLQSILFFGPQPPHTFNFPANQAGLRHKLIWFCSKISEWGQKNCAYHTWTGLVWQIQLAL